MCLNLLHKGTHARTDLCDCSYRAKKMGFQESIGEIQMVQLSVRSFFQSLASMEY